MDESKDIAALKAEAEELIEEQRMLRDLKAVADLQAEIDAVDEELRIRRNFVDKAGKSQRMMLDALGQTQEQIDAMVAEGALHPEGRDMMRKKLDEARRGGSPAAEAAEGEASEKKKKRKIMKI
ncbi:hypothetical protein [Desulfocurvus sp. DL9XJH121]